MNKKNMFTITLVFAMMLLLVACGNDRAGDDFVSCAAYDDLQKDSCCEDNLKGTQEIDCDGRWIYDHVEEDCRYACDGYDDDSRAKRLALARLNDSHMYTNYETSNLRLKTFEKLRCKGCFDVGYYFDVQGQNVPEHVKGYELRYSLRFWEITNTTLIEVTEEQEKDGDIPRDYEECVEQGYEILEPDCVCPKQCNVDENLTFFEASPETYCIEDSDCACGVHKETGVCFYGNERFVDTEERCPDFCSGIQGTMQIRCIDDRCQQVQG